MGSFVVEVVVGALVLGGLLLAGSLLLGRMTGLRSRDRTVAHDGTRANALHIQSEEYGVHGYPDRINETAFLRRKYAVERKPLVQSDSLYEGHELQAGAYILAMRETYGWRAANWALVVYSGAQFTVRMTGRLRRRVLRARDMAREIDQGVDPGRTHEHPGRCRGCSFQQGCTVRLR